MSFIYIFERRQFFFQFRSLSVSISIIWQACLFFRSYSGNLPAMFVFCHLFQIIPALRSFCIYAAMGILGIFLVTLFLFAGCFTYDQKRAAANRNACICCIKLGDNYKPNDCSENPLSVRVFDKVIARGLSYLPVKVSSFPGWRNFEYNCKRRKNCAEKRRTCQFIF